MTFPNVAINKGYMDVQSYAFRQYKIKTIEGHHTHLSPEELAQLEKCFLEGKYTRLRKTKDAFLFCCYAGLRYSDFVNLKQENLVELYGDTWLIFQSVKTKVEIRIPLYLLFEGKALNILKYYQHDLNGFFRLRDNSNINKELLLLSKLAGIKKRISFHMARHREFYKHKIINRLNCLLMKVGNDMEASELLYSTLFCHFKEPLCLLQR